MCKEDNTWDDVRESDWGGGLSHLQRFRFSVYEWGAGICIVIKIISVKHLTHSRHSIKDNDDEVSGTYRGRVEGTPASLGNPNPCSLQENPRLDSWDGIMQTPWRQLIA